MEGEYEFNLIENQSTNISEIDRDKSSIEEQEAIRFNEDTKHRGKLVGWVMDVSHLWLFFVAFSISLDASPLNFNISDSVIIALLGTATVNVLGLPYVVLKGLFPGKKLRRKTNK